MVEYTLNRSDRRTLGIYIMPDARIEVRAPHRCPVQDIEAFLSSKQAWIERKLEAVAAAKVQKPDFDLRDGGTLPYRGMEMPFLRAENGRLAFDGLKFLVPPQILDTGTHPFRYGKAIVDLYMQLALPVVRERVEYYVRAMGLNPDAVKISRAVKRWGSCSGRGRLNFSWMLAAAHPAALDYVVVHELCHLREHNHSKKFWSLVESVLPDYKERQKLLRQTEQRLDGLRNIG